jgi:uncharacterized membrane protein
MPDKYFYESGILKALYTDRKEMHSISLNNYLTLGLKKHQIKLFSFRLILFVALSCWCIGFLIGSIFPGSAYSIIALPFLKKFYGIICHQRIEKSFFYNGHYFMVCARCTGIYTGALITSFISLFTLHKLSESIKILSIAAIPMIIDVISTTTGIYSYNKFLALLTGIFFGSAVFAYILAAIENNFVDNSL